MVYRGVPSKGCGKCRQRRIRCDRQPLPIGCKPCTRAGWTCPGYPNELDQLFCHQTEHTLTKMEKGKPQHLYSDVGIDVEQTVISSKRRESLRLNNLLKPHVDDFALGYCYEHHIALNWPSSGADRLANNDKGLVTCMQALGMASYAGTANSHHPSVHARRYYALAIRALNDSLTTPSKVTSDDTLLVVMAMSYLEHYLGDNGLDAWANHIDGMAMLIHLRGREQLQTHTGRILFLQASSNMLSHCMRLGRRLPPFIHEMWEGIAQYSTDLTDPTWQVHSAMLRLTDFYSDAVNGRLSHGQEAISEATRFDKQLASIFEDPAEAWRYKEVRDKGKQPDASRYPGYVHIYQNLISSQAWNAMRIGRLVCNAIILTTMQRLNARSKLTAEHLKILMRSKASVQKLSDDILATVPQHIGFHDAPKSVKTSLDGRVPFLSGPRAKLIMPSAKVASNVFDYGASQIPVLRTSQGFLLVWCLAMVGRINAKGSLLRREACDSLRLIASSIGIQQALHLASTLEADVPAMS